MKTSDFDGKYKNDFNKNQLESLKPIMKHLSKVGITRKVCTEELMDCKYNGNEHPAEAFYLEFELVNNMQYNIFLGYDGSVRISVRDFIINDITPNYVYWS